MDIQNIVMIGVLVIYNAATAHLLSTALRQADIKEAVREKGPSIVTRGIDGIDVVQDSTSYSRVAGMIGAVVLATFFWAISNVILFMAFTNPNQISDLLSNLSNFFLGGTSLFLPYAFNQIREAFSPKK